MLTIIPSHFSKQDSQASIDKRCREIASRVDDFLALVTLSTSECSPHLSKTMRESRSASGDVLKYWQQELRGRCKALWP